MKLSELNFHLPEELIAQKPREQLDPSRMLLLDLASGRLDGRRFRELPELLRGDELIVFNNARVTPGRLFGKRIRIHASQPSVHSPTRHEHLQAQIEVLLIRQLEADTWKTLVRPGRKIPIGERIIFGDGDLEGKVEARGDFGLRVIRFSSKTGFHEALDRLGHIPLPPYIKRRDEPLDRERYQTVYAKQGCAVAAPTAGLHFTADLLARLSARGIETAEITLDVGLGTFEPVRTERLEDHKIHAESYEISKQTAEAVSRAKAAKRQILAIGTTAVRALEDAAEKAQGTSSTVQEGRAEAEIFLYPGKPIRVVDELLTNFHLPESSLLALVATLTGRESLLRAYRHAVGSRYRFYSYGDCMLIR